LTKKFDNFFVTAVILQGLGE